ncbi:renin receptor-like [Babylonia areolata]|uniref:renin receptor-like n=1 Tax=Babylonia areolata TaxID=304850 RepID=UPI003FD18E48
MSEKMASATSLLTVFVLCCLAAVCPGQKLMLTHAPSYVSIQEQSKPLSASDVPDVITDTLGLSESPKSSWTGLKSGSLFKRPKANVLLTVVTAQSSDLDVTPQHLAAFPVDADLPLLDLSPVMNRIQSTFLDHDPLMLDLMADANAFDVNTPNEVFRRLPSSMRSLADRLLDPHSVLSRVSAGSLNRSHTPDLTLMAELQMMDHVMDTLKSGEGVKKGKAPDLFSFIISGLPAVSEAHGADSQQSKDAHSMVSQFIDVVTKDFKQLYKDNVVVEVLSVPAPQKTLVRKARSLLEQGPVTTPASTIKKDYNLAWDYHDDFPAMFNIILWLTVVLAIAVFVIAYGMWNIDPGRDSIIYRMTSQRLKKD